MNRQDLVKNRWPILLLIPAGFSLVSDALNVAEKLPSRIKPFIQLLTNALSLPVPIYSVLLGAAVGAFLFINFGRKEEMSLKELEERIDIDLRSHGEQIHFSLIDSVPKVRIWLAISNMTPYSLTLESISWEFWTSQITKKGGEIKYDQVSSHSKNRDILLQADLIDSEVKLLIGSLSQTERKGNLSVTVSFHVGKEKIQKKASINDINYSISANVPSRAKEHDEKELFFLHNLASQHNKTLFSDDLKNILATKFQLAISDFNIMVSKLYDRRLITTKHSFNDAFRRVSECITITSAGLKVLDETGYKV